MPFGLLFGAVFFATSAVIFGLHITGLPPGFRLAELCLALLTLGLAVGLLLRQGWARWAGVFVALCEVWFGFLRTMRFGGVADILLLLGAVIAAILLALPATGNVRRGLPEGKSPRSRSGSVLGYAVAVVLAGFMVAYAVPAVRLGAAREQAGGARDLGLQRVEWTDFAPGLDRAADEGKPVLVNFFTVWCSNCKVMDRRTFRDPAVLDTLKRVVPVRIDAEGTEPRHGHRGEDLAERYRVMVYPTLVLMDSEGREIARSTGAKPPRQLISWLEDSLEGFPNTRPPGDTVL